MSKDKLFKQLKHKYEPLQLSRNRQKLRPNNIAEWELCPSVKLKKN